MSRDVSTLECFSALPYECSKVLCVLPLEVNSVDPSV